MPDLFSYSQIVEFHISQNLFVAEDVGEAAGKIPAVQPLSLSIVGELQIVVCGPFNMLNYVLSMMARL